MVVKKTRRRTSEPAPAPQEETPEVVRDFTQWATLKADVEALGKRQAALRDRLMAFITEHGERDEKGSLIVALGQVVEAGGKKFSALKKERRVSTSLDEEAAEALLERKGLLERAQKTITVLDHDEIYVLHQEGLLTEKEIDSLFIEQETWAFRPFQG